MYEIRGHRLVQGGPPPTIGAWRKKLPSQNIVEPIDVVTYPLDGPDWIVHIRPFNSLDQRAEVRRDLHARGAWPP